MSRKASPSNNCGRKFDRIPLALSGSVPDISVGRKSKDSWIFLFAAICAVAAILSCVDWVAQHLRSPGFPNARVLTILGLSGCLALTCFGFFRSLRTVPAFDNDYKQELVSDQEFVNTKVELDGNYFVRCKFENVTLNFEGLRAFSITNCSFKGPIVLGTSNPSLGALLGLEMGLGIVPKSVVLLGKSWGHIERPEIPSPTPSPGN